LTFLPIDDPETQRLLHLGVAGSVRDPDDQRIRFRARSLRNGPSNFATIYADTGSFNADSQSLAGLELVGVSGPWTFQSEWMGSWVTDTSPVAGQTNGIPVGTVFIQGYYAEVMYFLTGESREYDHKSGAFGRIIPYCNYHCSDGWMLSGAWQLLFRYEMADLNDDDLLGGQLNAYTVGINWFLNPNLKFQLNYVLTDRDYIKVVGAPATVEDGIINGLGVRLAHDF
jgi:phosphate-selective porin OprO/OprP